MQNEVPWEPDFEKVVTQFEEKELSSQVQVDALHPFDKDLYLSELRKNIGDFYMDIHTGYGVLTSTVLEMAKGKGEEIGSFDYLFPTDESLRAISADQTYVDRSIEEGKSLFEVLGLSVDGVSVMYEAACYLLDADRDEEARVGFRLLLLLAPHMADFWVGYGVAESRLKKLEEAVVSFERAVFLDVHSIQALLLLCRSLVELNRRKEAESRLHERLDEAARKSDRETYDILDSARLELSRFSPSI